MRPELHFILWVTACLVVVTAFFHGGGAQPKISSTDPESVELYVLKGDGDVAQKNSFHRDKIGDLAEIGRSDRQLFEVIKSIVADDPIIVVPDNIPILKGIVNGDGGRRAIFEAGGPESYRTAAEGDTLAGYLIEEIGSDHVVATGADNAAVTFTLRGAGERP